MRMLVPTPLACLPLTLLLAGGACSKAPTSPSAAPLNLTGTWSGSAADSTGFGSLTWALTQTGSTFTGTAAIDDRSVGITGRGTVNGSLVQGSVQFTLTVPAGGFDAPFETCSSTVSGEGLASATSLSAVYAGSSSCGGTITSGQLSLRRP